jgi:hypothetical protein
VGAVLNTSLHAGHLTSVRQTNRPPMNFDAIRSMTTFCDLNLVVLFSSLFLQTICKRESSYKPTAARRAQTSKRLEHNSALSSRKRAVKTPRCRSQANIGAARKWNIWCREKGISPINCLRFPQVGIEFVSCHELLVMHREG